LALEALARIAPPLPVRSLRQSTHAYALRRARTCYNHLAGRLGVALMAALLRDGHLVGGDGRHRPGTGSADRLSAVGTDVEYRLSSTGRRLFAELGVDLAKVFRHHPAIRYCVDWTEQQHHLSGPLGTALCDRMLALGWLVRIDRPRVIAVTDRGRRRLTAVLGVDMTWYR
ncbi:MAG: transcriptional regulator, partial [Candidatus Dormibacteraceae bacterium]